MTITEEELIWVAVRMFAYGIGGLLLCGVVIIVVVALAVTIVEGRKSPRL